MQESQNPGYILHPAGELSRGAVLDVGLKCVHSCKFCYYSFLDKSDDQFRGMRKASFRSLDECKEILRRLKENGFLNFDYTGGEPSLHQDIIEITRYAHQELGLKGRMITLGQYLMRKMKHCQHERLIDDLLEAGIVNFLFSTHAVEEELYHRITGESWQKLQAAMSYLDEKSFHYTSNTTVFEWNYKHLPDIAREMVKHNVYLHNFIIMNAYYEWNHDGRAFGIQAKYSDIHPYLEEAVGILESNDVAVNIRYAPLCSVKGMEKNLVGMVGVRYDPYEWMNLAGHMGGSPELCATPIGIGKGQIEEHLRIEPQSRTLENGAAVTGSRTNLKLFSSPCATCAAKDACDGIDPNYLKLYGADEFTPYSQKEEAPLQRARLPYRMPFMVKTEQWADMKGAVRDEFQRFREGLNTDASLPAGQSADGLPARSFRAGTEGGKAEEPAISVVIPCYNYGHYLAEAVESVLAQTFRDFEVVIVNDGSTDDTQAVAERLIAAHPDRRIRLINQPNSGQPAISRNHGIVQAKGRYILCLDGDDKLAPTMLEECYRALEADPSVAIAYTDRQDFDGVISVATSDPYDFNRLRYVNHLSYCALFRREVWEKVGGYRTNVRGCEDWDFWIAAGARGYLGTYIPQPLFHYRRHDTGLFQEALQNFEERRAQIVLNNREVYPAEDVAAAERLIGEIQAQEAGGAKREDPLVSVIIPTVNRPYMLIEAVKSVLAQTYPNVEIIVVNDAGAQVEDLINSLNERGNITYVRHGSNRERCAARNAGIRLAHGKYVAYLDDDDLYYPEHIETLVRFLEGSEYKVAYTHAHRAWQEKRNGRYVVTKRDLPQSVPVNPDQLLVGNQVPILCVMHERRCLDEVGLFDETLNSHEDWDLWIRLSRKFAFGQIAKVTCEYTWREDGSSTTSGNRADFIRTMELLYARYAEYAAGRPDIQEAQRRSLEFFRSEAGLQKSVQASIIIPTYNNLELTKQCLEALAAATPPVSYEVIVVDNASTDGTPEFLLHAQDAGRLRAVINSENMGFGKACNQAAQVANGRYLVFLNNDTIPQPGWLEEMVAAAEADAGVGIVGSKLIYPDRTIQHAGVVFTEDNIPLHAHRREPEGSAAANQARDYPAVTGACLLIRAELFRQLGGFDESYFMYVEDADLCLKVWEAGYRVRYCPRSVVIHLESASVQDLNWSNQRVVEGLHKLHARWNGRWPEAVRRLSHENAEAQTADLLWSAPLFDPSGYAEEARHFLAALDHSGCNVAAREIRWSSRTTELTPAEQQRLAAMTARQVGANPVHVCHILAPHFLRVEGARLNIGRTMFETNRLPDGWAEACNRMDRVWVPSEFNRETFIAAGVEADKIAVVPGAIDVEAYGPQVAPLQIEGARGFNFLTVFDWTLRKGWDLLLRAYAEEFRPDEDVALIFKVHSSFGYSVEQMAEMVTRFVREELGREIDAIPDIIFQDTDLPAHQMPALYRAADCFVLPSHGEGWGRPYMEAMASGLPTIGTNWSGNTAFMTPENSYLIDCTVVDVPEAAWTETPTFKGHRWTEPDVSHLRTLMRQVFTKRDEAQMAGARARADIAERFSYTRVAEIIQKELAACTSSCDAVTKPNEELAVVTEPWLGRDINIRPVPGQPLLTDVEGVWGFLSGGDMQFLLDRAIELPAGGTIVEIGSLMGLSSIIMANGLVGMNNRDARIVAVDTWEGSPEHAEMEALAGKDLYGTFLANVKRCGMDRLITPVRKASLEAAEDFEDGSVDLLFIDGDHSFEGCYADLAAWYPKLKDGGVLIGHDCAPGSGVREAVERFARERDLEIAIVEPPTANHMFRLRPKVRVETPVPAAWAA